MLQAHASLTIRINDSNDNAPVFVGVPYTSRVTEGAEGLTSDFAFTVTATDADVGNNSRLSFSFDQEYPEFRITTIRSDTPAQVG